jgi:ribonuclease HI
MTNEIIKLLPEQTLECIHTLFIIMWATGVTPNSWKESHTALLFKDKPDAQETSIKNYRPIALLNALYKLWTRLKTTALTDYAEKYSILSSTQKGFRRHATTMYQLQMMVMALEDARLTGQNMYLLSVDFSSAFNMIDHDKLLMIMYDLGFPTDAIEVVKDLYTGATTSVKWDSGITHPIPIERGSIQGDTLSPFLFLIYVEPLLRWLHVGARGYKFGSLKDGPTRIVNSLSSCTYADDLNAPTNSLSDIKIQAEKVSEFAEWATMPVNTSKTICTGILYRNVLTKQFGKRDATAALRAQLEGQILIQGEAVTYKEPTEPFTSLGVELTMTLDWKHQHRALTKKLRERIENLNCSFASPQQKQHIIRTAIEPSITYAFCVTPFTPADIKCLDTQITSCLKRAHRLPASFPTAFIHEDHAAFGMGAGSLATSYAQKHAAALIESLRDKGRMGVITRALLHQQLDHLGGVWTRHQADAQRTGKHFMRVRQLAHVVHNGLSVRKNGIEEFNIHPDLARRLQNLHPWGQDGPAPEIPSTLFTPLWNLGITDLGQVLEPSGTHVLEGRALKLRFSGVKAKHVACLNRIARLLNEAPGRDFDLSDILRARDTSLTLPKVQRKIHPDNQMISALTIHPTTTEIPFPCFQNDQHLISEYLSRNAAARPDPEHADHDTPQQEATAPEPGEGNQARPDDPRGKARAPSARREHNRAPTLHPDKKRKTLKKSRNNPALRSSVADRCDAAITRPPSITHNHKREEAKRIFNSCPRRTAPEMRVATVLETLYGHSNLIARISGWRMVTQRDKPRNCKRNAQGTQAAPPPERITQIQYLVHWLPSHIEQWALQYHSQAGYTPRATEPITREQIISDATCEVCFSPHSREHPHEEDNCDDILACSSCSKCYHVECLGHAKAWRPPGDESATWDCPACANTPRTNQDELDPVIRVDWQPSWEIETDLQARGFGDLIAEWQANNHDQPPARTQECVMDANLTNLERQGLHPSHPNTWVSTLGDPLRGRFTFVSEPVNPHADIKGTGACQIEIRTVDSFSPNADPTGPQHTARERACIYRPDGKCMAMCSTDRLAILLTLFDGAARAGLHDGLTPPIRSFEEEVLDLYCRYKPGYKTHSDSDPENLKNQWSIHPRLAAAIRSRLGTTKDRFASPLNAHADTEYWSKHERDGVFGARHDAYSCKWTGHSIAFPDHDSVSTERAIRWALWSARQTKEPMATLLALPRNSKGTNNPAYRKWLEACPTHCTHLATISCKDGPVWMEEGWRHAVESPPTPSWNLDLILVWNASAQAKLTLNRDLTAHSLLFDIQHALDPRVGEDTTLADLLDTQRRTRAANQTLVKQLTTCPDTSCQGATQALDGILLKAPRRFEGKPRDSELSLATRPPPTVPRSILMKKFRPSPLLYDWRRIAYTDGSLIKVRNEEGKATTAMGAGLYIPSREGTDKQSRFTIDPAGTGPTNTINRAELAGIWGAIQQGETVIATDSACSIAQLQTALLNPMRHRNHKHSEVLQSIISLVRDRPPSHTLTILKVKAHNELVGNEIADLVAKQATEAGREHDLTFDTPATPSYVNDYWLFHLPEPREDPEIAEDDLDQEGPRRTRPRTDEGPQHEPLENLKADLQRHMHKKHRLGRSNQESAYFNFWKNLKSQVDPAASNAFMSSPGCATQAQRRTTLLYRTGCLHNQKRAKWFRLAQSDACPLCRQPDGCSHIASGCQHPAMERMYTERHNRAGRIFLRAISKGDCGNDLVMADVGRNARCAADGVPTFGSNHISLHLLPVPDNATPQQRDEHLKTLRTLRPDALLVSQSRDKPSTKITIVEVKYCIDTKPNDQWTKAHEQHSELKSRLEGAGYLAQNISICPLLVGVSGTIYKRTLASLKKLGVTHSKANKCASKLHKEAIRSLHSIVKTRRHLEHTSNSRDNPPRPP